MNVQKSTNWMVAWICSLMSFLLLGTARLSGLLFVAVMDRYDVSRSQASLPFVLCYTVRNSAGPLIGYLGRRLGLREVCVIGSILSAIGIGSCFFAEDVITVTCLWGGIFGLGLGLSTVLIPEILRQHFNKDIAKANGIAFGGECLAGFLLPILFEVSLRNYGTQGTFLILSGLVMNSIPAALLLRKPKTLITCPDYEGQNILDNSKIISRYVEPNEKRDNTGSLKGPSISFSKIFYSGSGSYNIKKTEESIKEFAKSLPTNKMMVASDSKSNNSNFFRGECLKKKDPMNISFGYSDRQSMDIPKLLKYDALPEKTSESPYNRQCQHNFYCDKLCSATLATDDILAEKDKISTHTFSVFCDVSFLLMLLTQSFYIYIVTTVLTIVVDFSQDIGIESHKQIYIVMGMSIADMIGRFFLGFVTDSGCMSTTSFIASGFTAMSILLFATVWLKGFTLLMIVMFAFGLLMGGLLIVFPGNVSQFIEEDKITMALASRFSLYGPLSLTQSTLIGFFRSKLGSYDGVFHILSATCILCSVLTVLIPLAAKRRGNSLSRTHSAKVVTE